MKRRPHDPITILRRVLTLSVYLLILALAVIGLFGFPVWVFA